MDIICMVQANPVKINSNITNIATNCLVRYLFIIFIIHSIEPKRQPVKLFISMYMIFLAITKNNVIIQMFLKSSFLRAGLENPALLVK